MWFILREGLKKLKNYKKLTLATFLTSTISFLVLSIFMLITTSLVDSFDMFKESETQIIVFINSKTEETKIKLFEDEVKSYKQVKKIEYISSEEGLSTLDSSFNNDEIADQFKEDNPIPHTFILNFSNKSDADTVYNLISSHEIIDEIKYEQDYLSEINNTLSKLKVFLSLIVFGLFLSSVFFIIVVISLSIHNQRENIKIMLLTGAPISYIHAPFVVQGLIISVSSALLSSFIITSTYDEYINAFRLLFPFLNTVDLDGELKIIPYIVVCISVLLGGIGSYIAARVEIKKLIKK